jgi:transposase
MLKPGKMRIFAATTPIDLRRSVDGLSAAAREQMGRDPQSGALFLFVNKRGNRLKALWWDRTGFCILYKRLERGLFRLPSALRPGETSVAIEAEEFTKILEGIALGRSKVARPTALAPVIVEPAPTPA